MRFPFSAIAKVAGAMTFIASPVLAQPSSGDDPHPPPERHAKAGETAPPDGASQDQQPGDSTTDAPATGDPATDAPATDDPATEEALAPQPEVDPYAEAKERVGRAEKLYEEGNYDAALTEFQRAYDTMLGHPARSYVLYNIGRCQEKLYRYDSAIESYERYLTEAGPDAEDRGTVSAKIELLEGLLGVVKVSVTGKKDSSPGKYQVWVDGRLVGEDTTHFSIPSGNHEVEVRAEGFESEVKEVQVAARLEKSLSFQLAPLAKEYKGIKPTYFYATGGLAVAAGAVGAVYGVLMLNKHNDIKNTPGPLVTDDDKDEVVHRAMMADIFLISAGVLATSATVLAFLTDWSGPNSEKTPPKSEVRLKTMSFGASPTGGFLSIQGTFQ